MRYYYILIANLDKFYGVPARDKTEAYSFAIAKYGDYRVLSY